MAKTRRKKAYVGGYVPKQVAEDLEKLAEQKSNELGIHVGKSDLLSRFLQDGVNRELGVRHPEGAK